MILLFNRPVRRQAAVPRSPKLKRQRLTLKQRREQERCDLNLNAGTFETITSFLFRWIGHMHCLMLISWVSFQLAKLTVPILKDCIKRLGITDFGPRKAELIDAINEHFGLWLGHSFSKFQSVRVRRLTDISIAFLCTSVFVFHVQSCCKEVSPVYDVMLEDNCVVVRIRQ